MTSGAWGNGPYEPRPEGDDLADFIYGVLFIGLPCIGLLVELL